MSSVLLTIRVKEGYVTINDTHITFLAPKRDSKTLPSIKYIKDNYAIYDLTGEFSTVFELKNEIQLIALRISLNDLTSLTFTSSDSLLEILAIEHVFEIERIYVNTYTILNDIPSMLSPYLVEPPQINSYINT